MCPPFLGNETHEMLEEIPMKCPGAECVEPVWSMSKEDCMGNAMGW